MKISFKICVLALTFCLLTQSCAKVFYSPDLYVYHREREFVGFLLQRLCFGMDFINLIKFSSGLKGLQPILPIFSLFCLLIILALKIELIDKFTILGSIILVFNALIFIDVIKYVKNLKTILLTLSTINLVNLTFAFGGVLTLIGLKKFLLNNLYLFSRKRKKN